MRNARYLLTSTKKFLFGRGFSCPSCGGRSSRTMDRKWFVTTLRRCQTCRLLFRAPTTSAAENQRIYQTLYTEGFTTHLPDDAHLTRLMASNFQGTEKDYSSYLDGLRALGGKPGQRLYDFGCSWGYGSYQFRTAGYAVDSYEISVPRARFAHDKLGVSLVSPQQAAAGHYDVFFSAHVIEHVPSVAGMISLAMRLLKPGGLFLTYTPNGGMAFREAQYPAWHRMWGFVHPQLLDGEYVAHTFAGHRYVIGADPLPLHELKRFPTDAPLVLAQTGVELMVAVQKPLDVVSPPGPAVRQPCCVGAA